MKQRAFIKYTKAGKIIPGSLIFTSGSYPTDGKYKEVSTNICCDEQPYGYFDVTSANWGFTDEAGLRTFLESKGVIIIEIKNFSLLDGRLKFYIKCFISAGSLELDNLNITSVNIIDIPDLNILNLENNILTEFNPSKLSSTLSVLNLGSNSLITFNQNSIPLNLKYLILDHNDLTVLSIDKLINLTGFRAGWNNLSSLDISTLSKLDSVSLNATTLSSIDFTGSPDINWIDMSNSSSLTSVNVSGLTKLSNLNLNDCNLTSIDVSGLDSLEYLQLDANNLSTLNLDGLSHLFYFRAFGNNLTSISLNGTSTLLAPYYEFGVAYNNLSSSEIDYILTILDDVIGTFGYVYLNGTGNAAPGAAGLVAKSSLQTRGITVITN